VEVVVVIITGIYSLAVTELLARAVWAL